MKRKVWFDVFYSVRHIIAFLCAILSFFIIKQVAVLLYVKPYQPLGTFTFYKMLWNSNSLFFHIILIFNIFIKPLFIYFMILFLFFYFKIKNTK
ncbi:Uncharacterised protein [Legionella cincinnatiensis]|uniref:Uncharacterized protein n=1 Tax=Legionella cincinnatiensis TaxID=28085 RepID=A0A378INY9_9GAMM|nr:hypothetical protein Lcin_1969 [Legionella cincinnatiensis]STX36181.1 Uncharacterised protein [Legionella cincinnatiensis]